MSSSSAPIRKRKRSESPERATLKVKTFDLETSHGPRLACFPAVEPPEKTAFVTYGSTSHGELIAAETDRVEFEGREHPSTSHYLVAVYDKSKGTLHVRRAPLHVLERRVKRLKTHKNAAVSGELAMFQQQRIELGTTFGTKKAQAAIRAAARNKVDVQAMSAVTDHLQSRIESQTGALPTKEQEEKSAQENRSIPPHVLNANKPEDVYPISSLISEAEFSSLDISDILNAKTHYERRMLLPFRATAWLEDALRSIIEAPKLSKDRLKILKYICFMLAWRRAATKKENKDRASIVSALEHVPSTIVDSLSSRFLEEGRAGGVAFTTGRETRFNTWMLALMLHVDGFQTDIQAVAAAIGNATVPHVTTWFKALGCKVAPLSPGDQKKKNLADADSDKKFAQLKVPVVFPTLRNKPTGRR